MESFYHAVGLGVVGCCSSYFDAELLREACPEVGGEWSAPVGRYFVWDTEARYPVVE